MRDAFQHRRDVLVLELARMCDLAGTAIRQATKALLDNDLDLAEQVVADDRTLNEARSRTEHDAQILLALQAPVAGDLRTIVAVAHGAENAERMGDLAHHIALSVRRRHPEPVVPTLLRPRFEQMGGIAVRLATTAGRLVREPDPALARALQSADAEMDDLHRSLFTVVAYRDWTYGVPAAVDAILLSRYYERFADHAVSIARRSAVAFTGHLLAS